VEVHLVDGTYELFRHYYGGGRGGLPGVAAARGALGGLVALLADGATHVGVATDHVIESFRNDLWPSYKSSAGVPEQLLAQIPLLEEAAAELGVAVFAMVELEADDALASAAATAASWPGLDRVFVRSPDKDLAQCVRGTRVVQVDPRSGAVRDEAGVCTRFGVGPPSVPDWLALVGDAADGYPGLPLWGPRAASAVLGRFGHLEQIPGDPERWGLALRGARRLAEVLAEHRERAYLFRELATLRVDPSLVRGPDDLAWRGPRPGFASVCRRLRADRLVGTVEALAAGRTGPR
jgi:5'-3' exonuclease